VGDETPWLPLLRRSGDHAGGGLDFKGCDMVVVGPTVERVWCCFADDLDALLNCR
jgi:hypothetical protein